MCIFEASCLQLNKYFSTNANYCFQNGSHKIIFSVNILVCVYHILPDYSEYFTQEDVLFDKRSLNQHKLIILATWWQHKKLWTLFLSSFNVIRTKTSTYLHIQQTCSNTYVHLNLFLCPSDECSLFSVWFKLYFYLMNAPLCTMLFWSFFTENIFMLGLKITQMRALTPWLAKLAKFVFLQLPNSMINCKNWWIRKLGSKDKQKRSYFHFHSTHCW